MAFAGPRRALLGASPYLPQTRAWIAACAIRPAPARIQLVNTLINRLLTAGIWQRLDLLYLLAAADTQCSLINIRNPGAFTAVPVNAPVFTADRGWAGDGATSYLRTQYTPSTNGANFALDDASLWLWGVQDVQDASSDIGNAGNPRASVQFRSTTNTMGLRVNDNSADAVSNTIGNGFAGGQRRGSADKRRWLNGSQLGATLTTASTGLPSLEQWICGVNNAGFSTRQIGAAAWGASLSGIEAGFYDAMLAYMQGVGAA